MENITPHDFMYSLIVVLISAALMAVIMQRLRQAAIAAFLVTGAVIGPHALGIAHSPEALDFISHLAIVLLLFGIGLQLHLDELKGGLVRMLSAGLGSCLGCILVLWLAALAFGLSAPVALTLAMGLSLSSTAVVLRTLESRRQMQTPKGRLALAILVTQDMAVIVMMALLPLLATMVQTHTDADVAQHSSQWMTVLRLFGVAGVAVAARWLLPRLLQFSAGSDVMAILAIAVALTMAMITEALGFSPEMGAFLGGVILASTPFRYQLAAHIAPVRDLFMAVFFTTLGMKLDPTLLAASWPVVLGGVIVMLCLKTGAISLTIKALGAPGVLAGALGLILAQAGEFSIILFDAAQRLGIFDESLVVTGVSIVVISLVLTPGMIAASERWLRSDPRKSGSFAPRESSHQEEPESHGTYADHVIVAGWGPVGQEVVKELKARKCPCVVVELNARTVTRHLKGSEGIPMIFGDIASPHILLSAGVDRARALVLAVPDADATAQACHWARQLAPGVHIFARLGNSAQRQSSRRPKADELIVEEELASEAMANKVIDYLKV